MAAPRFDRLDEGLRMLPTCRLRAEIEGKIVHDRIGRLAPAERLVNRLGERPGVGRKALVVPGELHQLQVDTVSVAVVEQPLAAAEHDRVHQQLVLVDQAWTSSVCASLALR
jgi:hypothetical protein